MVTLRQALEIYRQARHRMSGGPHPSFGCNCAICDVVRAADLLAHTAREQSRERRWRVDARRDPAAERRARP